MGVLYDKYDLLDKLAAYKVRPAPQDPPGKFETGTGNFEGICGVLGALEYIKWVGQTFGAEHTERFAAVYTGRRLGTKRQWGEPQVWFLLKESTGKCPIGVDVS